MLFYDLDLTAWVRTPGTSAPPATLPVLTIGSIFELMVTFCRGTALETLTDPAPLGGLKSKGDFSGAYLASDDSPNDNGDGSFSFFLDLTADAAKAPFVADPTAETVQTVFQMSFSDDSQTVHSNPLGLTLQNDYLTA